ncbi:MAG: RNA polymerase sigma factor [candidate division Zixibacteria bacterium]|nr:RNA polymerase sigma factor [candidate division Zixibacteria bacterium]
MERSIREESSPERVNKAYEGVAERKLVEAAQNGDHKAFGKLVRAHQKRLFRYIYGLTGSFDSTEDIVQDAFIKAFNAIKTFRTEYAFYPWLSTIARNLAYNHIRREEKKQSLEDLQDKGFDPVAVDLGPLDALLEGENNKRFYKALMAMPVKYRSVFVLRHFEGMDYAQIASYLKIPPGTVDSRLYRARQILMKDLADLLNEW